jgi:hypothetical protein
VRRTYGRIYSLIEGIVPTDASTPLFEATLDDIRQRLGREPTLAEWVMLARAAIVQKEMADEIERMRRILDVS